MSRKPAFKIGDAVTLHTSQSGPQTLLTVKKFTEGERCMVLSDGSEWRPDGARPFRNGGAYYRGPWIEKTVQADIDHVARRRAIGLIRKFASGLSLEHPISTDALKQMVTLIGAAQPAESDATDDGRPEQPGAEDDTFSSDP